VETKEQSTGDDRKVVSVARVPRAQGDRGQQRRHRPPHLPRRIQLDGKATTTRIGALQVWQKQDGAWKLLARQGFVLPA
jgi:hypothetical protein